MLTLKNKMSYFITVLKQRIQKFIDNPFAIFYFIRRNFYDQFVADKYVPIYKKIHFLNPEETFNYIIDNNSSIIRLGDGEFGLIRGASVYFNDWRQRFNKDLQKGLIKVISSHNKNILVCLPCEQIKMTKEDFKLEGKEFEFKFWINSKILLHKFINMNQTYGSPFAFYPAINTKIDYKKLKDYLFTKHVIIITSNTDRFKNIHLGETTHLIESSKSDAWDNIKEIIKAFYDLVENNKLEKQKILAMVSMGPGAKVFVYELASDGFTAWDAGQFFDLAYKNIKEL